MKFIPKSWKLTDCNKDAERGFSLTIRTPWEYDEHDPHDPHCIVNFSWRGVSRWWRVPAYFKPRAKWEARPQDEYWKQRGGGYWSHIQRIYGVSSNAVVQLLLDGSSGGKYPLDFEISKSLYWENVKKPGQGFSFPRCHIRGQEYTQIYRSMLDRTKNFGIAVREPTNPHDRNAIRLYAVRDDSDNSRVAFSHGMLYFTAVGYVAKEIARVVAKDMDRDGEKTALVRYYDDYSSVGAIRD